jgi:antitoxin component YwqK of YwqJK toxin-antitoxin module
MFFTCWSLIIGCTDKKVKMYDDLGRITEEFYESKNHQKNGSYTAFYPSGKIREKCQYKNGTLTGKRILYYENGQIEIEETYSPSGLLHGPYYIYYDNGKLKLEKSYSENVMEGILKTYYPDGTLKEEVTMSNNTENGPFSEYYQNGQLHWKGTYRNGDNEYGLLYEFDSLAAPIKIMRCDTLAICRTIWKVGMPPLKDTSDNE